MVIMVKDNLPAARALHPAASSPSQTLQNPPLPIFLASGISASGLATGLPGRPLLIESPPSDGAESL